MGISCNTFVSKRAGPSARRTSAPLPSIRAIFWPVLATIDQHIGIAWVARSGLEPEIVDGLRQGLLSVPTGNSKESTGFEEVEDRSYEYMRRAIERAKLFDAGMGLVAANPGSGNTRELSAWAQVFGVTGGALVLVVALGLIVTRWRRSSTRPAP